MRVLLLSWDVHAADGGLSPQVVGLARALQEAGDHVRVVTRLPEGAEPPAAAGLEVHAVPDAPPIIPATVDDLIAPIAAFSTRAAAVATRLIQEEAVDIVHVEGWQATYAATSLRASHDVPLICALDETAYARHGDELPDDAAERRHQVEWWLTYEARRLLCRSHHASHALHRTFDLPAGSVVLVPPGADVPARMPGPPPEAGPVLLVPPPGSDARARRAVAQRLRHGLHPRRRITTSWARRPFAVAVLDPAAIEEALRALALGVPLIAAAAGPVGELLEDAGAGMAAAATPATVAAAINDLARDVGLAQRLGAAGPAHLAAHHRWPQVAAAWRLAAADAIVEEPAARAAASLRPLPSPPHVPPIGG